MTKDVESCPEDDFLESVVQIHSASKIGAILIADNDNYPKGVISKTDIILCYRHGIQFNIQPTKLCQHLWHCAIRRLKLRAQLNR